MFNICVAQSGGPTAAINASLAGVYLQACSCSEINYIYGAINGINGVINDDMTELKRILISDYDTELLKKTPSTILGSCRFKLRKHTDDDTDYKAVTDTFLKHNIKMFFYIGGNDSMDTVMKLDGYFKEKGIDIKVIGVPKTIDNDVYETDHTPGFGSAAKYVATTMQEIIRDSRVYSIPSVTIVEIMGRDTGWLTASSCVLRSNGEPAPHLIYLPEAGFSAARFLDDVKKMQTRHMAVIIAVSEGITCDDENYTAGGFSSALTDAFGHKYLSGIGKYLEKIAAANLGCKVRSVELNVMQRCSSHIASLTDINESERIGRGAVNAAFNGESGVMMIFRRISNNPYRIEISTCDIKNTANRVRYFPKEWINNEQLHKLGVNLKTTQYGEYILSLLN